MKSEIQKSESILFGDNCCHNLILLNTAYQESILKKIKINLNIDIQKYHPILGISDKIQILGRDEICDLGKLSFDNFDSIDEYQIRSALFEKLTLNENNYKDKNFHMNPQRNLNDLKEIRDARTIIESVSPWMGLLFSNLIVDIWITNYKKQDRFMGGGSTRYELIGLMFMSLRPTSEFTVIEQIFGLAHELGHTVLYLYQAGQLPIAHDSWDKWVYSGLRKTERPSYASLHAAVALGFMHKIAEEMLKSNLFNKKERIYLESKKCEFASNLKDGLLALRDLNLTKLGKQIEHELWLSIDQI